MVPKNSHHLPITPQHQITQTLQIYGNLCIGSAPSFCQRYSDQIGRYKQQTPKVLKTDAFKLSQNKTPKTCGAEINGIRSIAKALTSVALLIKIIADQTSKWPSA